MSRAHLEKLKLELGKSKWILRTDVSTNEFLSTWEISRPNNDCLLEIEFGISGNGEYGACIGNETMDNAIGCSVSNSEISIYFGKYSGQFQKDIAAFISQINQWEKTIAKNADENEN